MLAIRRQPEGRFDADSAPTTHTQPLHNHCPHPHQILELMPRCVLNKRIISARANGATISAGRKAAQVVHVSCPGPYHGEGLDRLHRAASPHHVKGARGMGARAAGAGRGTRGREQAQTPPPARSAPSRTNNADRRHVRRGATHGDRSVHTHRPPTQPPEARGQKAQEKKSPRRDVAGQLHQQDGRHPKEAITRRTAHAATMRDGRDAPAAASPAVRGARPKKRKRRNPPEMSRVELSTAGKPDEHRAPTSTTTTRWRIRGEQHGLASCARSRLSLRSSIGQICTLATRPRSRACTSASR